MSEINYRANDVVTAEEFIAVLSSSTLGESET